MPKVEGYEPETDIDVDMDGFDMDGEDDEDDDFEQDSPATIASSSSEPLQLDHLIVSISDYQQQKDLSLVELRHNLFELTLRPLAMQRGVIFDNLILASSVSDVAYNTLLSALYPPLAEHLTKIQDDKMRPLLIELLSQALGLAVTVDNPVRFEKEVTPQPTSTSDEDIFDDEEEDDPELIVNTMRVLKVYKDLFEVGFELVAPTGVMLKDGLLKINRSKTRVLPNTSLGAIYQLVNDLSGGFLVQSETHNDVAVKTLRDVKMRKGTTYYPEFQLGNLFGILGDSRVDSWDKLKKAIEPEIARNIKANLEAGKDVAQIVDALTTCLVVSEFDPKSAIKLRINVGNDKFNKRQFELEYANRKKNIFAGMGELFHCEMLASGVLEVTLVFNMSAFNGKPLFAYEAIEALKRRGRKPSLRSMILGQDTSGKILTTNLDTQQACILLVGAGQRSGKGVLTLNLLGTVLSDGCPLIYMDGKPDMAPVLWNMGKKYNVNPAAWDLFDSNGNVEGFGAPERLVTENPNLFGLLMYFKMLQLMMVSASLQAKDVTFLDGKRPFFVFDEAFAVQMTMSSTWQKILDIAKDKGADADEKAWCTHIVKWAESLNADLPAVINSQLPKSGVSTVWLFQSMQPSSWDKYQVSGLSQGSKINVMKKPVESRLSLKFLGRGTADSEYALGSQKVKENRLITTRVTSEGGRHFAMSGSQKILDMSAVTVFKPYLVLNESENGTRSAEELKSNLSPEVLSVVAPDGELNKGVGFEGFANLLGDDAIQNLSKGRDYLESVMSYVGIEFTTIEDYIYSADMNSFKTLGELVSGASKEEHPNDDTLYSSVSGGLEDNAIEFGETTQQPIVLEGTPSTDTLTEEDFYIPDNYESPLDDNLTRPVDATTVTPSRLDKPAVETEPSVSPEDMINYASVYSEPLKVAVNPFRPDSRVDKPLSAIHALNIMSDYLLTEIKNMVGDLSRVHVFEATSTGLVINNIAFRPTIDPEVVKTMPYDIRLQVERGNLVELFNFKHIARFTNLEGLHFDDVRLAEGRIRREIGLSPKKSWYTLFSKYRHLVELTVGGTIITDEETSNRYEQEEKQGYELQEKLTKAFKIPSSLFTSSRMNKVWDSRPVKITTSALGWTAGVKAVSIAAAMFGPWGLLFGAFGAYGAYQTRKNRKGR